MTSDRRRKEPLEVPRPKAPGKQRDVMSYDVGLHTSPDGRVVARGIAAIAQLAEQAGRVS